MNERLCILSALVLSLASCGKPAHEEPHGAANVVPEAAPEHAGHRVAAIDPHAGHTPAASSGGEPPAVTPRSSSRFSR